MEQTDLLIDDVLPRHNIRDLVFVFLVLILQVLDLGLDLFLLVLQLIDLFPDLTGGRSRRPGGKQAEDQSQDHQRGHQPGQYGYETLAIFHK